MKLVAHGTRVLLAAAAMLLLCLAAPAADDVKGSRADEIKAVFVYKFTGYVTWPDDDAKTFTIAVLGNSTMLGPLKKIAEKRPADSRPIAIKVCKKVDEITGAHILLISESMKDRLDAILAKAADERILTVGDSPGFAEKGVAINLFSKEDRVSFEINLGALKRAGLSVSSQLIKLATLVDEPGNAGAEGKPQ